MIIQYARIVVMVEFLFGLALGVVVGWWVSGWWRARDIESDSRTANDEGLPTGVAELHARQQREKQQALETIMAHVREHGSVTNDVVEELTGLSDATASRYLDELQEEGLLNQIGETGRSVRYTLRKNVS